MDRNECTVAYIKALLNCSRRLVENGIYDVAAEKLAEAAEEAKREHKRQNCQPNGLYL